VAWYKTTHFSHLSISHATFSVNICARTCTNVHSSPLRLEGGPAQLVPVINEDRCVVPYVRYPVSRPSTRRRKQCPSIRGQEGGCARNRSRMEVAAELYTSVASPAIRASIVRG